MPDRDATLDAFITTDDETEETEASRETDQDAEATDVEPEATGTDRVTERAVTTFAWSPDAIACDACGDKTRRRWRTDAGFVCPDCVDWERTPEH